MKFIDAMLALYDGKSVLRRRWRAGNYLVMDQHGGKVKIAVLVSPKGQHTEVWRQQQEDVQSEDWEILR